VTLCAVPVWRLATHLLSLLLHPAALLRVALGWRAIGTAAGIAALQACCVAAFVRVNAPAGHELRDTWLRHFNRRG